MTALKHTGLGQLDHLKTQKNQIAQKSTITANSEATNSLHTHQGECVESVGTDLQTKTTAQFASEINWPEGNAIVYCEGSYNTTNGKTAHGLVRFCERYKILSVIDSTLVGQDAGIVLEQKPRQIPIMGSVEQALLAAQEAGIIATHLVIGLAPDGGRLNAQARTDIGRALALGLHVDCGLHDFLSEDPEIAAIAAAHQCVLRDVRKPPSLHQLHFFSGKIEEVSCLKIAMLGTDSAVGKRTTAWMLIHALRALGYRSELIGTGQTSWMQGARFGIILDSLVNDFVSGEIEHAVWSAWTQAKPDVIVLEGQGSLLNPAYPGGFELLAAGRPDAIILQHAPARKFYDGFPKYPIQPLSQQIHAIEVISGKPVVAIALNREGIPATDLPIVCNTISQLTGLPTFDVLQDGAQKLADVFLPHLQ